MRRILALTLIVTFAFVFSGCNIVGDDPSPTLTDFRDKLIRGRETAIKGLFVVPASIEAEIFNCEEKKVFTFETDLENHFKELFAEKDFTDITIEGQDTIDDGDGSATITGIWHFKWGDEEEDRGKWEATFGMKKVGGGAFQRGEWKIKSIILE